MTTAIAIRTVPAAAVKIGTRVKLTRKECKPLLDRSFPNYNGRKFSLVVADRLTLSDTNWGGGTRNSYAFIREDGAALELVAPAPWRNPVEGETFTIPDNVIVVEHTVFCGKDLGIRFYVSSGCKALPPAAREMLAPPLLALPAPAPALTVE